MKLIYFTAGIPDLGPVRVRSLRSMILRPLEGPARPVAIGEEITISDGTLRELTGDDIEVLGPVPAELDFEI